MGRAKDITVRPVTGAEARAVVERHHYSGKAYNKSRLHLGVFLDGKIEGAMQFGPPLDQRKVMPLVPGTPWNGMMELNRMAFSDGLPRNSESRALGVAFRQIRARRPDVKWVLSYSDATQCGDGTIYRASGFLLTGIKRSTSLYRMPDGEVLTQVGIRTGGGLQRRYGFAPGRDGFREWAARAGAVRLIGYQFRYVKFLDPEWTQRLAVPVIPFADIPNATRMYRGVRGSPLGDSEDHSEEGGSSPTLPLHADCDDGDDP